ncbi:FUSC family protein [Kitasatospora sp. NPDC048365]|uniref:FUSC family protein n=1 Tax=Kitasatospora sp. NPDC048365 TaxID=3364050 RepID=UPI00371B0C7C
MRRSQPPRWLAHPLRWQRGPVPWAATARSALGTGPLLAAGAATGHPGAGVLAGLGALFAAINDRPGTRRTGALHIGVPALGGAAGLLAGTVHGWSAVALLTLLGLVSGAVSVAGAVSSAAGVQVLVLAAVGSGMPLALPGWARAGCFLAGAAWILLLRLLTPQAGERAAVAAVFDALADALAAVGTPGAEPARRRLTAALDRADEALRMRRLLRLRATAEDGALETRFAAAAGLCEAAVALLWEGTPLPARAFVGPRRLAEAVRAGGTPGPLPVPVADTAARTAFDRAVLDAGVAFGAGPGGPASGSGGTRWRTGRVGDGEDSRAGSGGNGARSAWLDGAMRTRGGPVGGRESGSAMPGGGVPERGGPAVAGAAGGGRWRGVRPWGPAGREYGVRVAVCVGVSAAVAVLLRADHWYWLPVTAAFLVKPDYGPLFSRVVNRFAGTAAGVLLFAGVGAAAGGGAWPAVAVAGVAGLLLPVALRHFGAQTAAVTLAVLAFAGVAGDAQAALSRLVDTALACAIVLLVGHLPRLADTRARVGHRSAYALRSTRRYLDHVLAGRDGEERGELRRAAYHALAQARGAAETAAAELRTGRAERDWLRVTARAERIADAATACAVRLEHGAGRPAEPAARRITATLTAVADTLDGHGPAVLAPVAAPPGCRTLDDILTELHAIHALAGTGRDSDRTGRIRSAVER